MFKKVSSEAKNVRKFYFSKKMLPKEASQLEIMDAFFNEMGVKRKGLASHHDEVYVYASPRYVYIWAKCYKMYEHSKKRQTVRIEGYLFYRGYLFYEYTYYNHEDTYHNREENLVDKSSLIKRNYELQESVMTDELDRIGRGSNAKMFSANCNRLLRSDNTLNTELYMEALNG